MKHPHNREGITNQTQWESHDSGFTLAALELQKASRNEPVDCQMWGDVEAQQNEDVWSVIPRTET